MMKPFKATTCRFYEITFFFNKLKDYNICALILKDKHFYYRL